MQELRLYLDLKVKIYLTDDQRISLVSHNSCDKLIRVFNFSRVRVRYYHDLFPLRDVGDGGWLVTVDE